MLYNCTIFFQGDDKAEEGKGKKKVPVRTVELPVEVHGFGSSQRDLDMAMEKEVCCTCRDVHESIAANVSRVNIYLVLQFKMIAGDNQEKERVDARNALEEYVYDLRGKLSDDDQLSSFVTDSDRESLCRTLNETENWLYEEGVDCDRHVYAEQLQCLKVDNTF